MVKEAEETAGRLPQREQSTRRNPGTGGSGLDRLETKLGSAGSVLRMAELAIARGRVEALRVQLGLPSLVELEERAAKAAADEAARGAFKALGVLSAEGRR